METRIASALVHLARPLVGNEVRKLVRELRRFAGVGRVALPSTKASRLVSINYDPRRIQLHTLLHYVRRGWAGARLV